MAERDPLTRSGNRWIKVPVAANTRIEAGNQIAIQTAAGDDQDFAVPVAASTSLNVVGVATRTADNTSGAAGALWVTIDRYPSRMRNSEGAEALNRRDIGSVCYAVDGETVSLTNQTNTLSEAGLVFDVEPDGSHVIVSYEGRGI